MKNQPKNFGSTIECATQLTPHGTYESLAIDAALLQANDQLPSLSEEEQQRLISAASTAAQTVLALAQVPDVWLDFVGKLQHDRREKMRSEMWESVFDLLPGGADLSDAKTIAEGKIMTCARPGREEATRQAMNALADIYMGEVLEAIYSSFQLGYEIAHDPTRLLFEKVGAR